MSHEHSTARRIDQTIDAQRLPALEVRAHLKRLVADADHRLRDGDIIGMDAFVDGLSFIRQEVQPAEWRTLISDVIAPHPILTRLHEEPFTRRAFQKPRGYPGDAPLLDLIYRDRPLEMELTPLGRRLHAWAGHHPGCLSVRERRRTLATLIDQVAADRPRPRVLSLACGHLREAQGSEAVRRQQVKEFVAIDQDSENLAVVDREQRHFNVNAVHMSLRRFLTGPTALGSFDLAYAAGIFDYLVDDVAVALTRAMFSTLRPGGTLFIANFAPGLREAAYMEAIMDWKLLYRDETAVARFTSGIPSNGIADVSLTRDSLENVVYLRIRRG